MRKLSLLLVMLLLTAAQVLAQRTITGKVTSADDGNGMPGVTILVKGTTVGVLTDVDGKYSIEVPRNATALLFSFIGMKSQEVALSTSNVIDVVMESEARLVEGVVVTALGITREKKSLGYATQEVKGDVVSSVKSSNFVNNLSGKLAGVQVQRNQNMGGSTNVVVRGFKSLTGNNQVLYVVDGVPINNNIGRYTALGVTSGQASAVMGYDYGNAASDINPEDIESINMLKGAAATALYGSRAANGVVMITTKKGKLAKTGEKQAVGVSLNSSFTFSTIDKSTFPTYQDQYGAGYGYGDPPDFEYRTSSGSRTTNDPVNDPLVRWYVTTEDASYGPRFDGQPVWGWYSVDPESPWYKQSRPWEFSKNGPITFLETPLTYSNTISIDKSTEFSTLRISYTNYNTKGLMPNSTLNKDNVLLNGSWNVNKRLTVNASANYIKQKAKGRNATGYNGNIITNFRQWAQTNVDFKDLKTAYDLTHRNLTWNYNAALNFPIFTNNPYWDAYENYQNDARTRFLGYASVNYKLTDWLDAFGRVTADTYFETQEERRAVGSVAARFGILNVPLAVQSGYLRRDNTFSEYNFTFMLNFKKKLSESFNLNGLLGAEERRTTNTYFSNGTLGGLNIPGVYSLQNSRNALSIPLEVNQIVGVRSWYGSVSLGYKDFLFLDGTYRYDYVSTLSEDESKYGYPSVSGSFLFSNLVKLNWLSLGKLRLNYAAVGNLAGPDQLYDMYQVNNPFNGANNQLPATKRNPLLVSELTKSYEAGLEMSFFNSRLGFDFAVYKANSYDQIMAVTVSQTCGWQNIMVNAGNIENKGIELALNANPVNTGKFRWDIALNWTKNKNEVVELYTDPTSGRTITNLRLNSVNLQGGVTINAEVGQPYGVIKGNDYTYDNEGNIIIDEASGTPVRTTRSDISIGCFQPDWIGGITNTFSYKNLSFSFLFDMQQGGDIWSLDMYYGLSSGLYPETAFTNDLGNPVRDPITYVNDDPTQGYASNSGGYIIEGVNVERDDDGNIISSQPNVTRVDATNADGFGTGLYPRSAFVYDASYVKLREVALTYTFPAEILKKTFLKGASIGFVGSNLWILSKHLPYADPESGMTAGNIQGYSVGSLPTTRDFTFNLKLNF